MCRLQKTLGTYRSPGKNQLGDMHIHVHHTVVVLCLLLGFEQCQLPGMLMYLLATTACNNLEEERIYRQTIFLTLSETSRSCNGMNVVEVD